MKLVIPALFDEARDFTNGVAAVRVDQKWGYIDKSGRLLVQPVYENADDLDETLAMITLNAKTGYVNKAGQMIIEPHFSFGEPFVSNYARVGEKHMFGYIDRQGLVKWDPQIAAQGFINRRPKEYLTIKTDREVIHNRTVDAPPYREPAKTLYPPEYLNDQSLPID